MPTYDFACDVCGRTIIENVSYEKKDDPIDCHLCGQGAFRRFYGQVITRTAKTSRTFLDGQRNDGYKEEIKAAQLDAEAMNHDPSSSKYKELKAEAATRRLLNNNPNARGKRYRLNNSTEKKGGETNDK